MSDIIFASITVELRRFRRKNAVEAGKFHGLMFAVHNGAF